MMVLNAQIIWLWSKLNIIICVIYITHYFMQAIWSILNISMHEHGLDEPIKIWVICLHLCSTDDVVKLLIIVTLLEITDLENFFIVQRFTMCEMSAVSMLEFSGYTFRSILDRPVKINRSWNYISCCTCYVDNISLLMNVTYHSRLQLESQWTQASDCFHWFRGFSLGCPNWRVWTHLPVSITSTESSVSSTW